MAVQDYPVCVYCGADEDFQRWGVQVLEDKSNNFVVQYTCYSCDNVVVIKHDLPGTVNA
jgi:hypothetical protein